MSLITETVPVSAGKAPYPSHRAWSAGFKKVKQPRVAAWSCFDTHPNSIPSYVMKVAGAASKERWLRKQPAAGLTPLPFPPMKDPPLPLGIVVNEFPPLG